MRLRFLFLPLIAVAPVACRSTDSETPPADPTVSESSVDELSGGAVDDADRHVLGLALSGLGMRLAN